MASPKEVLEIGGREVSISNPDKVFFPALRRVEVRNPVFIIGHWRSGTTHLHNLLAADPGLRSLPYWESLEPVPIPGEGPGREGVEGAGGELESFAADLTDIGAGAVTWCAHGDVRVPRADHVTVGQDTRG